MTSRVALTIIDYIFGVPSQERSKSQETVSSIIQGVFLFHVLFMGFSSSMDIVSCIKIKKSKPSYLCYLGIIPAIPTYG